MSIDRIYYCDAPDCGRPVAQGKTWEGTAAGSWTEPVRFCSWDCLMKYAASHSEERMNDKNEIRLIATCHPNFTNGAALLDAWENGITEEEARFAADATAFHSEAVATRIRAAFDSEERCPECGNRRGSPGYGQDFKYGSQMRCTNPFHSEER